MPDCTARPGRRDGRRGASSTAPFPGPFRSPALHAEHIQALRQYAAYSSALRVLQEHKAAALLPAYHSIHAPGQKVQNFLNVCVGEENALFGAGAAGGVECNGLFNLTLGSAQQGITGTGQVRRKGEGKLFKVFKTFEVLRPHLVFFKKAAVKAALFCHLTEGLFYLPQAILIKKGIVHRVEITVLGLCSESLIPGYTHGTKLIQPFFKMYAVFASFYHGLSYSREELCAVAAAQILAAQGDKLTLFGDYLYGAALYAHKVDVPRVLKGHAADGKHLLL